MDSRRLVVWIAAGILGFQGGTLVLDLLNCSVLSWLYVRRHGLELSTRAPATAQRQLVGEPLPTAADGGPEARPLQFPPQSLSLRHALLRCPTSAPQQLPPPPRPRRPLIPPASSAIGPAAASMPPSARGSASWPGSPWGVRVWAGGRAISLDQRSSEPREQPPGGGRWHV